MEITLTPEERIEIVESLLADTYRAYHSLLDQDRGGTAFELGKAHAYGMVLDAFAAMGFDIAKGVETGPPLRLVTRSER